MVNMKRQKFKFFQETLSWVGSPCFNTREQRTTVKVLSILFFGVFAASCRVTSSQNPSDILTLETSAALDDACRRESVTATPEELNAAESGLSSCLGSGTTIRKWLEALSLRIESNWPTDFLEGGPDKRRCLEKLTIGAQTRYLESLTEACKNSNKTQKQELLTALSDVLVEPCFDITHMTSKGCFVAKGCANQSISPKDFGHPEGTAQNQLKLCSSNIQKIHTIKDPDKASLLYNYSYVSELTGNQSYNRITYGPPNCHGVAQAAAGDILDMLKLETIQYARLPDENRCKSTAVNFFEKNKSQPIGKITMSPGGLMINMRYEACEERQCGKVALWVEDCLQDKLKSAIFIDGMCVNCWEKYLAAKGLKRQTTNFQGKQFIPGCILTTADHSVMIIGKSHGMCFFYEATSPYGPPQIRAIPCPVLNQKFMRQYCPERPSIEWSID